MLLSNGLPRPKIRLKKFGFSLKIVPANIVRKLPSQRCFKPLFIASFNFSHKRRNTRFNGLRRVHTPPQPLTMHTAAHRAKQGPSGRGRYHYPRHVLHVHEHPRAGCQNGVLCRFGILPGRCSRRTQRAFGTAMRLCASLSRRRRSPAGLRDLFRFCRNCGLYALRSGPFRVCEARGGITLEMSRNVQSGNTQNLKSSAASDQAAVCACAHSWYFTGGSPSGLRV